VCSDAEEAGRPGEAAAKDAAQAVQNKLKGVIKREKRRVEREELAQVDEKLATSPQDKLNLLRPVLLPVVEPATAECRTAEDKETQVSLPSSACITHPGVCTHKTNDRHAREHAPSLPADPPISTSEATDAPELPWPTLHEHEARPRGTSSRRTTSPSMPPRSHLATSRGCGATAQVLSCASPKAQSQQEEGVPADCF